jgi:DNA-binding transcriptional MerR regulator
MGYTIREVARIFGNTVGGIRFFEDAGLVNPGRDAGDNRTYTLENILELFYLRKYCTFGLKIREVAECFTAQTIKDIEDISGLLEIKQREAEERALYHRRSAEWIKEYNRKFKNLKTYLERFTPEQGEDYLLLMDDTLVGKSRQQQEVVKQWIAASPLSRISCITQMENGKVVSNQLVFSVKKSLAEELKIPMPSYTRLLKGAPCLYRVIKRKSSRYDPIPPATFESLAGEIEAQGHRCAGLVVNNVLFLHKIRGVQYKYSELWFPVDTELPLII